MGDNIQHWGIPTLLDWVALEHFVYFVKFFFKVLQNFI